MHFLNEFLTPLHEIVFINLPNLATRYDFIVMIDCDASVKNGLCALVFLRSVQTKPGCLFEEKGVVIFEEMEWRLKEFKYL